MIADSQRKKSRLDDSTPTGSRQARQELWQRKGTTTRRPPPRERERETHALSDRPIVGTAKGTNTRARDKPTKYHKETQRKNKKSPHKKKGKKGNPQKHTHADKRREKRKRARPLISFVLLLLFFSFHFF